MSTTPTPVLNTDTDLTNLVADLAQKQIIIEKAKSQVQTTTEAAKLAFDEATRDLVAYIEAGFKLIDQYCAIHRDRLFPKKGSKRSKTFKVLEHKLQYRSSSEVTAPEDIVKRILARLDRLKMEFRSINFSEDLERVEAEMDLLKTLLRQPPLEFNKPAASTALASETTALQLAPLGIDKVTTEAFKLEFVLTPNA